jgi:anti-sigma factor RsiW
MNCERLRENLYDYLDDALSPAEKAAAQRHLLGCSVCRQAVQSELLLEQTLSSQLKQAVETIALDASARRGMARAVQRRIAESQKRSSFSFWSRLAVPVAAAGLILMAAISIWIGQHSIAGRDPHLDARVSPGAGHREVPIHVSYSVPGYTFQREGALVVDALTSDTRVVDGALLAKK